MVPAPQNVTKYGHERTADPVALRARRKPNGEGEVDDTVRSRTGSPPNSPWGAKQGEFGGESVLDLTVSSTPTSPFGFLLAGRATGFPKDKTLRDAWQRVVRRDGWEPKNADVLCSEHFEANCFDRTGQTTRLRPGSIVTIFPAFPAHLQKPAKRKREAPKCRTALSPVVSAEAAVEMPSEPSSPAKDWYRSKAEESAQEVLQLKKKVKILQQSKRRLSKRCDASENLIKELKERKLLSEKGLEVQCKDLKSLHANSDRLMVEVLTEVFEQALFSELEPHLLDCDPLDNHIYVLVKKIANLYITIRLHHISKEINRKNSRSGVRTQLTRTIIFKNL
ncbi:hypothetical protein HPB51_021055 [Rhipicephalus microplus]|uniref:THAP-type domain-containing protein n=1 Tax=Rhipicephalus microplus TaxID=6941 RepID=A0A9J6EC59_RHIMP|nr:hypothetical protein HPB51_021055 [Rhipicephalus microplus]